LKDVYNQQIKNFSVRYRTSSLFVIIITYHSTPAWKRKMI